MRSFVLLPARAAGSTRYTHWLALALWAAVQVEKRARLLEAEGFRSLQAEYQLADTQDGAWATLELVFREQGSGAVDQTHRVFAREEAAPPGLQRLWAALEALRDRAGLR